MPALLRVRLTPRSSTSKIEGWKDGVLRVRVTAPPIENRANEALIELLAKDLRIPKSAIILKSGCTGRAKTFHIENMTAEAIAARW